MRRVLNLVRRGRETYPLTEEDYQYLVELQVPILKIGYNMYPILHEFLQKKKVRVEFHSFKELEQEVFNRIREKLGDDFVGRAGDRTVTWAVPNDKKGHLLSENLGKRLEAWYKKHHLKVEIDKKGSRTKIKTKLHKLK
jgi:hypothetical protein